MKNCKICNKEINEARIFCSYECRNTSYVDTHEKACEYCGLIFYGNKSKLARRRFCSQECVNKWKKEDYSGRIYIEHKKVNCDECGEEIVRMPCKINNTNFCNKSCKSSYVFRHNDNVAIRPSWTNTSKGIMMFRSRWEACFVVDFLDAKKLNWAYERKKFKLSSGKFYIPDFLIEDNGCYIEVKGYSDGRFIEKFNMFRIEYPEVPIVLANQGVLEGVYGLDLSPNHLEKFCFKSKKEAQLFK